MKYCQHCQAKINTDRKTCPLCREILTEIEVSNPGTFQAFPKYQPKRKPKTFLQRLFYFISIVVASILMIINYYTFEAGNQSLWSLIILTSIFFIWTIVRGLIISKANLGKRLFWFGVALMILSFTCEYFWALTPNFKTFNFSRDYVLPFLLIALTLILDFACVLKKVRYKDYIGYMLVFCLFCVIPYLLGILKLIPIQWPIIASMLFGGTNLLGMFLLAFEETTSELKKRFYI